MGLRVCGLVFWGVGTGFFISLCAHTILDLRQYSIVFFKQELTFYCLFRQSSYLCIVKRQEEKVHSNKGNKMMY